MKRCIAVGCMITRATEKTPITRQKMLPDVLWGYLAIKQHIRRDYRRYEIGRKGKAETDHWLLIGGRRVANWHMVSGHISAGKLARFTVDCRIPPSITLGRRLLL